MTSDSQLTIGPAYVQRMAAYNRWMNERLYEICAGLDEAELKSDRGAYFKSIHGTLNHILLGDRAWFSRFQGTRFQVSSLDQILYENFTELRAERALTDAAIESWAQSLTEDMLKAELEYRSVMSPGRKRCLLWLAISHFFNHQTHHRGQLTTLLSQLGIDPGATDLIFMPGLVSSD